MILIENDNVCGFTFIGKESFDSRPEFLSSPNTYGVLHIFPVYTCVRFIELITQFRPYHDFFSKVFFFFAYRHFAP